MSGHEAKIKTRCPQCRAKYRVPVRSLGHRARCVKCNTVFRVRAEVAAKPVPSEDDILRWLNEDNDDEFLGARPRLVAPPAGDSGAPPEPADDTPQVQPTDSHDRIIPRPIRQVPKASTSETADAPQPTLKFRKTG